MLVLTRKVGEKIVISDVIHVVVVAVQGERVRLGIQAPAEITVDRHEIHESRVAKRHVGPVPFPVAEGKTNGVMDNAGG
jgi:carbon storage regulator